MKNIIENNKLIAEFMGLKMYTDGISWFDKSFNSLKKYHKSWDWLMPVIEKIEESCSTTLHFYSVKSMSIENYHFEILGCANDFENTTHGDNKIKVVYDNVIKFIKWYNKNKQIVCGKQ